MECSKQTSSRHVVPRLRGSILFSTLPLVHTLLVTYVCRSRTRRHADLLIHNCVSLQRRLGSLTCHRKEPAAQSIGIYLLP